MCFGKSEKTKEVNTTKTESIPAYLTQAGQWNVQNVQNMAAKPYENYGGQRVADLTGDTMSAFDTIRNLAGSENPYVGDIESLYRQYATNPAQTLNAPSILGGGFDARTGSISDYMNPYIDAVLNPQMRAIDRAETAGLNRNAAAATMEGAFGDARHGVVDAQGIRDMNQLRADTTGKAYAGAFDAASALRGKDVANLMDTDKANATLLEQALQRAITGGTAFRDLDKYNTGRDLDLARSLNLAGQEQQKNAQDRLSAQYEEFLRGQQWGPEMAKLLATITGTMPYEKTSNTNAVTTEPNNSGWQMLGSLAGTAAKTLPLLL